MTSPAVHLLRVRGAGTLPHPGGTLLTHLHRVYDTLASWGAREDLCLAGLCHAYYGTDGFGHALGDRREVLVAAIGPAAEQIVYRYGACSRAETYPTLTGPEPLLIDRFTGERIPLGEQMTRDFAELTVANELDVMIHSAELRALYAADLAALFRTWDELLSPLARAACAAIGPELDAR